jgi:FSR family fosmidomycin resistance protein-like MFS transporter
MPLEAAAAAQSTASEEFHASQVTTISAAHAVHDTYTSFLPALLPVFIERLALSNTQAGLLTVFREAPSLFQPLIGHLADRTNLRTLVILTPAVSATVMSLLGLAPAYFLLIIMLLVVGLSSATLHAVAPVIAGRFSGKSLGRGMGFWMVGGEMGRTLGPVVIVSAIQWMGLNRTPWLMLGGWLASALLFVRLRNVEMQTSVPTALPWRQALRVMRPLLIPLAGISLARAFMLSALTTYLPIFLTQEGSALWFAGVSLSVLEIAGVAGALFGGSWSDRVGRRRILFLSLLITPLAMFVFLAVGGWARFPLLLLLGFTALSTTPVFMALVQESYPENRSLANGVYMALSFTVTSLAAVALGAFSDFFGMRQAFVLSAVVALLGLPVLAALPMVRK